MGSTCGICGDAGEHRRLRLREMQLGLREEFDYFQCARCGCVQIETVPDDLGRFYAKGYYSLSANLDSPATWTARAFFRVVKLCGPLVRYVVASRSWPARTARALFSRFDLRLLLLDVFSRTGITRKSRILDVGTGIGFLPYCLRQIGFENVLGIDPFLERDLTYRNGLRVLKTDLLRFRDERPEPFDLIMLNHSLEHMPDQRANLRAAADLLAEGGVVLVRIPVADCYAFEEYGVHHVSLDAPRHLFVHTRDSVRRVVEQVGLRIDDLLYDANESSLWASEQYRRNIPLESPESYRHRKRGSIVTPAMLREYRRRTVRMNAEQRSDWLSLYLRKGTASADATGTKAIEIEGASR